MKQYTLFSQPRPKRRRVKKAKDTRNAAYVDVRLSEGNGPGLGHRQQEVYDFIASRPAGVSNSEIASALGWSINRVTPRTKELRELGYVVAVTQRKCTVTGAFVWTWRAAR